MSGNNPSGNNSSGDNPSGTALDRTAPATTSTGLLVALCAASGLGPLAIDMYVSGLPALGRDLHASDQGVQLTVSGFLLGLMLGQLLVGPLSDRFGRRRPLLAGLLGYAACSLACAAAPTLELLVAARVLAAVGAATGTVLARAVITDLYTGPRMGRAIATISTVLGVAPVAAPAVGGLLLQVTTWRTVFVVLGVLGAAVAALAWRSVPESLPAHRRVHGPVAATYLRMGRLLRDPVLLGHILVAAGVAAALFTYISESSFVYQQHYGVDASRYTLIYATSALGMLLAAAAYGATADRITPRKALVIALGVAGTATAVHVVGLAVGDGSAVLTWVCSGLTLFGIGLALPAVITLAQHRGAAAPGATSALVGTAQFLAGAAAPALTSVLAHDPADPLPMAIAILVALAAAALAAILTLTITDSGRPTVRAAATWE